MDVRNSLLISFFAHVGLAFLLAFLPSLFPGSHSEKPPAPVEVSIIEKNEKPKQILSADALLDKMEKVERETNLLADKTRRVVKESQAPLSAGRRQSSKVDLTGPAPDFQVGGEIARREQEKNPLNFSDAAPLNRTSVQDVQIGAINALNTDQDMFYSFYSRVNDLIWIRWTSRIRQSEAMTPMSVFQQSAQERWTTIVDASVCPPVERAILNCPAGRLAHVMIVKPSGFPAFDQDAKHAFEDSGYFPNPPPELVQDDGYVHLKYALTVISPKVYIH